MSEKLGVSAKKGDFSEWYNETIRKADLADYSPVSGCMIIKPDAFSIWEAITAQLDGLFKQRGVRNAYFPLLIPESLLKKESQHVEGFTPEVAWVTHSGETELGERLAVRPTSEAIMYDSFSKWVRSWRDLPLKINQWCNVVRWEFKHPRLFLRTREFLWQEGHTVFATKPEAEKDVEEALEDYRTVMEEYLAIPVTKGTKTEKEKFAGADYTRTIEAVMPDGLVIQAATSHHLGQNFSKAFGIKFSDKESKEHLAYQNSWGFTTRSIGIMIAIHGDDKGLIIPPRIAPVQAVIVPIYKDDSREKVMKEVKKLETELSGIRIHVDSRDEYTPGFKFNQWEMKGVPIRIEIGPKDIETKMVVAVRRDTGEKIPMSRKDLKNTLSRQIESMQKALFEKAKKMADSFTSETGSYKDLKYMIEKGRVLAPWCGSRKCEDEVKEETGAKISCLIGEDKRKCVKCGSSGKFKAYFARSY